VPPGTFTPICTGRFLQPGLLVLADSHTCPQSSTTSHSLTHSPTIITYFAPRRPITTCSHHSTCDLQRYRVRSHYFAATVATYHAAYCQLFSIPISLPLYNRHFRSLYPFSLIIFSARRYCHYIMHHYFLFPVYYDDREIIFFKGESCCIAYRINCILYSL